jgi:hypothetical protein
MAKDKAYRASAPYVTVTLLDEFGGETVRGFYEGGILPSNCKTESVEALIAKGMVEEVDAQKSEEAEVVPPKNTIGVTAPKSAEKQAAEEKKAEDAKAAEEKKAEKAAGTTTTSASGASVKYETK